VWFLMRFQLLVKRFKEIGIVELEVCADYVCGYHT
jgi:hypothetical protein